ncbi:MAG: GNAT family N-acetyltransferase [Mucilaginibacter sp.]|jgi:GNAT superfamily N-acetyltransferase
MAISYRIATRNDIPAIAYLRSLEWETEDFWVPRVTGYMNGVNTPQHGFPERIVYVAEEDNVITGFIAGHLTTRLNCGGELEWINVETDYRRKGIAAELVHKLAAWFIEQNAHKICVDPGNENARKFYTALGAENLNQHWMYWQDISILL